MLTSPRWLAHSEGLYGQAAKVEQDIGSLRSASDVAFMSAVASAPVGSAQAPLSMSNNPVNGEREDRSVLASGPVPSSSIGELIEGVKDEQEHQKILINNVVDAIDAIGRENEYMLGRADDRDRKLEELERALGHMASRLGLRLRGGREQEVEPGELVLEESKDGVIHELRQELKKQSETVKVVKASLAEMGKQLDSLRAKGVVQTRTHGRDEQAEAGASQDPSIRAHRSDYDRLKGHVEDLSSGLQAVERKVGKVDDVDERVHGMKKEPSEGKHKLGPELEDIKKRTSELEQQLIKHRSEVEIGALRQRVLFSSTTEGIKLQLVQLWEYLLQFEKEEDENMLVSASERRNHSRATEDQLTYWSCRVINALQCAGREKVSVTEVFREARFEGLPNVTRSPNQHTRGFLAKCQKWCQDLFDDLRFFKARVEGDIDLRHVRPAVLVRNNIPLPRDPLQYEQPRKRRAVEETTKLNPGPAIVRKPPPAFVGPDSYRSSYSCADRPLTKQAQQGHPNQASVTRGISPRSQSGFQEQPGRPYTARGVSSGRWTDFLHAQSGQGDYPSTFHNGYFLTKSPPGFFKRDPGQQ